MLQSPPLRFKVTKRHYSQSNRWHQINEHNALYRQLFEHIHIIKLVIDPITLQIVEANPAACDFYGYTHHQITALRVTDINPLPESEIRAMIQEVAAKTRLTFQLRHRLSSGVIRDVEISTGLIESSGKKYIYTTVLDITERKRVEKTLRDREALYRLFVKNMPNSSVMMFDTNMRYTLTEGAFLRRHGKTSEAMLGKTPHEALNDSTADFVTSVIKRALQGESFDYERQVSENVVKAYVTPLADEDGQIIGGMILSHDITEIRRSAAALKASENLYHSVIDTMSEGVVVLNQTGDIQSCNPSAERILGLSADQMMGRNSIDPRWRTIHQDGSPFPGDTHPAIVTLRTGQPLSNVIMGVHKPDDTLAWISINSRPLIHPNETQPYGVVTTSIEISERKRTEDALRESEARFHSLVDLAPVGIIQTDSQGKRVFCNTRWCEMTGITLEEALGDDQYETIYPDDRQIASEAWHNMMATNLPFENAIFRYQRPDKSTVWVSGNGRPLFDAQGNVTGYIGAVTDISERKQLEEALVTSEERFRTLVDFAPVGIVEMDTTGKYIFANNYWSGLSNVAFDRDFSANASNTIHPDDRALAESINQTMFETTGPIDNMEYRFLHSDGTVVWVSDSSSPMFNSDGALTGYILAMTDITKRKELEDALRVSEERLRLITDNIQDVIILTDENNRVEFVNPSIKTILGFDSQVMIGLNPIKYIYPDDRQTVLQHLEAVVTSGDSQITVETQTRHADGHYVNVEVLGKLLRDKHSNYRGGVFIVRDITQRKLMANLLVEQEKLQTALDKEMELNTLKTRMMDRIAHEFRTPLSIVQSSMESLTYYYDRLTPAQRTEKEAKVRDQIRRITDMLDEIGSVIKGSFTPDHIHRFQTDMSMLCRDIATQLEKTLNHPNRYVLDMPPTALVSVDANVLKKAIQHIMHNAALYSAPSSVVTVRLTQSDDKLQLAIIDSGIGIPPDDLPRLFEPFFRGSNIGETGGLGIRMTLALAAVEAHGGTITVASTLGEGATFTITLPT